VNEPAHVLSLEAAISLAIAKLRELEATVAQQANTIIALRAEADKWISVKDNPPGEGVDVVIAHYAPGCIADNLIQSMTSTAAYITKHPERFTHWMPLPDPPTDNAVPAKENIP
jgi:Protein of unknown function (DUF551)